jgi:hypothetical protein
LRSGDGRWSAIGARDILAARLRRSSAEEGNVATGNGGQVVTLPAVVTLERDDPGEVYVAGS